MIDRVRFEGLEANLKRMADGRANWEGLLAKRDDASSREKSMPQIAGIEIRDGALDYIDEQSNTHYRVSDWDLDVGAWKLGELVPVSTELQLARLTDAAAAQSVQLELESEIRLTEKRDRIELRATELKGDVRGSALPEKGVAFETHLPELAITLEPLTLNAPEWRFKVADAELAGSLTAEKTAGHIRARGPLTLQIPSVRELIAELGIDAPMPKDDKALGVLSLKTAWAFVDGAIALKPITLQLDETAIQGEVLKSNAAEPVWTFDLRGDHIDLQRYLITEDTSDEPFELPVEALRALHAQGTLAFDHAQFGETHMKNARLRVLMADGQIRTLPVNRTAESTR